MSRTVLRGSNAALAPELGRTAQLSSFGGVTTFVIWVATLGCLTASVLALADAATAAIEVKDAWIRWLPGKIPAGGYLTLVNTSDHAVSLVSASSADYAMVSLHQTRVQNGTSRMAPVDKLTIPAHATLKFASEGYHLMLQQPRRSLHPGDHVAVTLNFSDSPALTTLVELRNPDAAGTMPGM